MAHNTSHLPPEIVEIILSKLSLKPLVRFRSVCKSWNTMISDPVFIRHRRSTYLNSDNLFMCHDVRRSSSSNTFSVVKVEDKKLLTVREIESPYGGRWQELCFCEGMILLTDGTYRRFDVWNPYTRTSSKLCHFYYCCGASFGLCCDPTTDDFKVVFVDCCSYWAYSRNNKSWTTKEKFAFEYTEDYRKVANDPYGVCVDGASYWAWSVRNVKQILYFDPRDDELKMLQKPESLKHMYNQPINLVDFRGSLCMYCCKGRETRVQIWTKGNGIDNHSWNELITVENVSMSVWDFQPLCFVGNKIVIRNKYRNRLLFYSPSEKRFEEFEGNTRVLGLVSVPIPYVLPL